MKKSRFSEEQTVTILREADRTTAAEAANKHKVSEPTIYAWRKHFGRSGTWTGFSTWSELHNEVCESRRTNDHSDTEIRPAAGFLGGLGRSETHG